MGFHDDPLGSQFLNTHGAIQQGTEAQFSAEVFNGYRDTLVGQLEPLHFEWSCDRATNAAGDYPHATHTISQCQRALQAIGPRG
jgi:hypothetical protein